MDLGRKFRLVAKNDVQLLEFYQTVEKVVAQTSSRVHLGFKNLTQKFSSCNFIQLYQFYTTADSCAALDTILNFIPEGSACALVSSRPPISLARSTRLSG
jgi:hypothetical protein